MAVADRVSVDCPQHLKTCCRPRGGGKSSELTESRTVPGRAAGRARQGRVLRLIATIGLGLCAWSMPSVAAACSSLGEVVARYRAPGADDGQREAALRALGRGCPDYAGAHSDRLVFEVLVNAIVLGFDRGAIQRVYDEYECVLGARGQTGYQTLAATLDSARCPPEEVPEAVAVEEGEAVEVDEAQSAAEEATSDRRPVYRLNVSAANLRRGPGTDHPPVAVVYDNQDLLLLDQSGSWYRIETPEGVVGYVFSDLIERVR